MMDLLSDIILRQFGASIDMIERAINACPEGLWGDRTQNPEFWYVTFHTLFWLDLYLGGTIRGFTPPAPFTREELDPAGIIPSEPYSKQQLRDYLSHCRKKFRQSLESLTPRKAHERCVVGSVDSSYSELLLYTMRHVQHHAGQLNLILRQRTDSSPGWVVRSA
ncbi:MAG TPA: DinB family protein [Bacteroidota bacterium]|nr:DinB family protein [Bacteroidota bacterium]